MAKLRTKPSRSELIASSVENAIERGVLPPDALLTETALAEIFRSSRTPVRAALRQLAERGLIVARSGRGYCLAGADSVSPGRVVTQDMLRLEDGADATKRRLSSQSIEEDFENILVEALPFGQFRINESAAAEYFGVSRTVTKELLTKFLDRRLVRKDPMSHWIVGPLTAQMVQQHYELRWQLEPMALKHSVGRVDPVQIETMIERINALIEKREFPTVDELTAVERDLHATLLSEAPNPLLNHMIQQCQAPLVVNRLFFDRVGTRPARTFLDEHRIVLDLSLRGAIDAACESLRSHLRFAADRTAQRLKTFSVFQQKQQFEFLQTPSVGVAIDPHD